jgi:hypothetical protein
MEYIIQLKNGQPFEHPILIQNFLKAFPNIDINDLGVNFVEFVKIQPLENKYQIAENAGYGWVDGKIHQLWNYKEMSDEEKIQFDTIEALLNNRKK